MPTVLNTELFPDRLVLTYSLQKPYGMPDEQGKIEVLYSSLSSLPAEPESFPTAFQGHVDRRMEIPVPDHNVTVVFVVTGYMEKSAGPYEHDLNGPYRKR